jgi:hypothetical protein
MFDDDDDNRNGGPRKDHLSGNFDTRPKRDKGAVKARAERLATEAGDYREWSYYVEEAKGEIDQESYEGFLGQRGWELVTAYPYTNPSGQQLYVSRRYHHKLVATSKLFLLQHREGDKWVRGAGPVRVPYNWPELVARPNEPIDLTEGEKAVAYLKSKGLLATCVQGQNWTEDVAAPFAGRTVNIVMDNDDAGRANLADALHWLSKVGAKVRVPALPDLKAKQGLDDWLETHSVEEYHAIVAATPIVGELTTFPDLDPTKLPLRAWLYGSIYMRQFSSLTVANGGVGKSSLVVAEALAMVSGRPLLNVHPAAGPLRVFYWNGEDPIEELHRRFAAAMKQHKISHLEIAGRLFVQSGRTHPIMIAEQDYQKVRLNEPQVQSLIDQFRKQRIDVVIIDPYVSCHRVRESVNDDSDLVAKAWGRIAEEANLSVMLLHHTKKTGGAAATVEDERGAIALIDAVRYARVINKMTATEATNAEIEEGTRWRYMRQDNGKANMSPPESATWYQLQSVDLENALPDPGWSGEHGDNVGVATSWTYPMAETPRITMRDVRRVQEALTADGPWAASPRAERWFGKLVARELAIDLSSGLKRKMIRKVIDGWLAEGWFREVQGTNAAWKPQKFIETGEFPPIETSAADFSSAEQ